MQDNTFNSIITADTVPSDLTNCSFTTDQFQCSIKVIWMRNPDNTQIVLEGGSDRKADSNRPSLKNTVTLKNDGTKTQWTRTISYRCFTEKCNDLSTLKRLLRSLRSEDNFNELSYLLQMNGEFNGSFCTFTADSKQPCETEIDPNICKQCAALINTQSESPDVCLNCVWDDDIENYMTREVRFLMDTQQHHDLWMIECQVDGCNSMNTSDLVQQKSIIEFNFNLFFNGSHKLTNFSSINIIVLVLIMLKIKVLNF